MAIQTIKATMQMRYGLEEDLEPDQLTTGEWVVSTDTKYVRMCFRPGLVLRMATYEAFEQDMVEIQTILATCRDIQAAVERFEQLAEQHKNDAASSALLSESWAHGDTGVREEESSDNSKYWSQQSKEEADRAKEEADRAASIVGLNIDSALSETSTNPVQNKVVTEELNKKLNKDGSASNVTVAFSEALNRSNIQSGENLGIIFGKVKRFFSDLKTVAFTGKFSDLSGAPQAVNNLNSNSETDYLAAAQGAEIAHRLTELNGKSYADGYIFVELGAVPNKNVKNIDVIGIPSDAKHAWIDTAWAKKSTSGLVLPLPYVDTTSSADCIRIVLYPARIQISTAGDWSYYSAWAVVAYKM